MPEPAERFDLITMGRIGDDLYPLQSGVPLQHAESFEKFSRGASGTPPTGDTT